MSILHYHPIPTPSRATEREMDQTCPRFWPTRSRTLSIFTLLNRSLSLRLRPLSISLPSSRLPVFWHLEHLHAGHFWEHRLTLHEPTNLLIFDL